jgi:hypothetical protein
LNLVMFTTAAGIVPTDARKVIGKFISFSSCTV